MNAPLTPSKTLRIDVLPLFDGASAPLLRATDTGSHRASPIRPDEFYRFFETAYDASLITDEDGAYVMANRRVTDLFGYVDDDLRQTSIWQLISGAGAGTRKVHHSARGKCTTLRHDFHRPGEPRRRKGACSGWNRHMSYDTSITLKAKACGGLPERWG